MSLPLPVILCGKSSRVASAVIASLKPQYEVLHVITSPAAGSTELPALLRGQVPTPAPTETPNLGSRAYAKKAIAVITGAAYDDASFAQMRRACQVQGAGGVPWLRPDLDKPAPMLGLGYEEAMGQRVKVLLREMAERGDLGKDGVYFY